MLIVAAFSANLVAGFATAAGEASCTGDPCAQAVCGPASASAHAFGSFSSGASASAGDHRDSMSGAGNSHASAAGGSPSAGDARGASPFMRSQRDTCSDDTRVQALDELDIQPLRLTVGCSTNDATIPASLEGPVLVGSDGTPVLVDERTGLGLPLPGAGPAWTSASVLGALPANLEGMRPTGLRASIEFLVGVEEIFCGAHLFPA